MNWKTIAAEIERTATARGRLASGRFSVQGFRLIERAFAAGYAIDSVVVAESAVRRGDLRARRLLDDLEGAGVAIVTAPNLGLRQVIDARETGAIAALLPMPPSRPVAGLIPKEGPGRLLVAVDVDDPGNLGALMRTALAGGADGLIVVGPGDPYHPRAVRISRGSLFRLPVTRIESADELLEEAARRGVETLAAIPRGGIELPQLRPEPGSRWAICVGSEAFGLPPALVERMDRRVSIPMSDGVDSFSVHAAAAILLYALRPEGGD